MDVKRTRIASAAVDFSRLFEVKFGDRLVTRHVPMLLEPPGVSTADGAQALQQIVLRPRAPGSATVNVGSLNCVTKTAKLRTYDCVWQVHQRRFPGQPFTIEPTEYQLFLDDVRLFLRGVGMQLAIETQPPDVDAMPSRRPPAPVAASRRGALLVWAVLATLLALGLALYFLLDRWPAVR